MNEQSPLVLMLKILGITVLLGLASGVCLSSLPIDEKFEEEIHGEIGYLTMDSNTILESITKGASSIFSATDSVPELSDSLKGEEINWDQADYLRVAEAVHLFVWNESVQLWKLHRIHFRMSCIDIDRGYLFGDFEYYSIIKEGGQNYRLVHNINIRPGDNSVEWMERELFPIRENWQEIDLSLLLVSVDRALSIAEISGGDKARLESSNDCDIHLLLKPDGFYSGWQVGYSSTGPKNIFKIYIKPDTGDFQIQVP